MSEKEIAEKSVKTNINWFPGHMTKAKRQMEEHIKLVDMVIELRDARIPLSSENPLLKDIIGNKPRMIVLTKIDKAEPQETKRWIAHFEQGNTICIGLDLTKPLPMNQMIAHAQVVLQAKRERDARRGIRPRPMRAMIVGIPNVGKSTLINRFAKRKVAITGDRPGVTKAAQWIKVSQEFELLDTPGVLWPRFDNDWIAKRLAVTGAIKDQILPKEEIALFAMEYIIAHYPKALEERYQVAVHDDPMQLFEQIGAKRMILKSKGEVDVSRTMDMFIKEIRDHYLGSISWETVDESWQ